MHIVTWHKASYTMKRWRLKLSIHSGSLLSRISQVMARKWLVLWRVSAPYPVVSLAPSNVIANRVNSNVKLLIKVINQYGSRESRRLNSSYCIFWALLTFFLLIPVGFQYRTLIRKIIFEAHCHIIGAMIIHCGGDIALLMCVLCSLDSGLPLATTDLGYLVFAQYSHSQYSARATQPGTTAHHS